jgi:hypothetical protein
MSYWSCYFWRQTSRFKDHPGYQVLETIGVWQPEIASKLVKR